MPTQKEKKINVAEEMLRASYKYYQTYYPTIPGRIPIGDNPYLIANMNIAQLIRFAEMEKELRIKEHEIDQQRINNAINILKKSK